MQEKFVAKKTLLFFVLLDFEKAFEELHGGLFGKGLESEKSKNSW